MSPSDSRAHTFPLHALYVLHVSATWKSQLAVLTEDKARQQEEC